MRLTTAHTGPVLLSGTSTQVGIIMFSEGCARPGKYTVATDVSKYLDWINAQISRNGGMSGFGTCVSSWTRGG